MTALINYIAGFYSKDEYPALNAQFDFFEKNKPFRGVKILDATPIFRNTMVKYAALLAGGADLTISTGKDIPFDPEILKIIPQFNIRIADKKILDETFDVVADCAGRHNHLHSRFGFAELTRSGLEYYRNCTQPVFSVDSGILKLFETTLGTGESFVRAMKQCGFKDLTDKKIVIFGGGKVGRGTAFFAAKAGADTIIVDKDNVHVPNGVKFINSKDADTVTSAVENAWCIVSATGSANALTEYVPLIKKIQPLIANMGVEDEFGAEMPESMVMNKKQPLNFLLEEPTRLAYIDPSMALSNAGMLMLLECKFPPGINIPPEKLEMKIIDDMKTCGNMNQEIELILKENS